VDNAETLGYAIENIKSVLEMSEAMKAAGVAGYDEAGQGKSVVDPKAFMNYVKKELKAVSIHAVDIFIDLDALENSDIQKPLPPAGMLADADGNLMPVDEAEPHMPTGSVPTASEFSQFGESLVKRLQVKRKVRTHKRHRS
jgi:hypothetical protein